VTGRGAGAPTAVPPLPLAVAVASQQVHEQAGQLAPTGQAGQAQAQPPPPEVPPSAG